MRSKTDSVFVLCACVCPSVSTNRTCCGSGAGRRGHWGGIGPAQAQQRWHAAASLGASTRHVAAFSRPLTLVLWAGHKLICLVDHHTLREERRRLLLAWYKGHCTHFFTYNLSMAVPSVVKARIRRYEAVGLTFLSSLKGLPNVCRRLGCSGSASRRGWGAALRKSW